MRVNVVVVAAGEGKRIQASVPKPFLSLGGRALVLHTLARFAESQTARRVILVVAPEELSRCKDLIESESRLRGLQCVLQPGGRRRQDSVKQGLDRLDPDCEVVLIHDGARPLISPGLVDQCVEAAFREGAVVVGVPARDTIKFIGADRLVRETPPRDSLWEIQTPQAFRVGVIREAYDLADRERIEATDDAMLVERLGKGVTVLEGSRTNLKITTPEDLLFAEALLRQGRTP